MFTHPRKLQIGVYTLLVYLAFTLTANAQSECPQGMVCLSQTAANVAASNARELFAIREKVIVLETSLVEKDKIAVEIKASASKNEADLRSALSKTEIELGVKTGQLLGAEAMNVRQTAIIDLLLKSVRPKKIGLINF